METEEAGQGTHTIRPGGLIGRAEARCAGLPVAMITNRALLLTLTTVVGALLVSVVSYAQTAPASATNQVNIISVGGGSGSPVSQDVPGSTTVSLPSAAGSTAVAVADAARIVTGDYVAIREGLNVSYHTVTTAFSDAITVTPPLAFDVIAGSTTVTEQSVYPTAPTWNAIIGATTSVKPGNHFLVNAKGLSTSSATAIDIILTNGDQLTRNYGHLIRRLNVYVLCDAEFACIGGPFVNTTAPGEWGQARDAAGTDVSEVADFITLTNARQGFILGGGYVYGIVVDGGTVFTVDTSEGVNDSLSPTDLAQSSIF